jgi:hypothetical protein
VLAEADVGAYKMQRAAAVFNIFRDLTVCFFGNEYVIHPFLHLIFTRETAAKSRRQAAAILQQL